VRKRNRWGVNWEGKWEEGEGQRVGEMGGRMVVEKWSMGEEAWVK
jgi:hypothetical protein